MKAFVGFLILFLWIGACSFMYLEYSSKGRSTESNLAMVSISSRKAMTLTIKSRKLKDYINPQHSEEDNAGDVNLEDYEQPVDPVPSSMNSIRPGPIQHGTPLMPYIPPKTVPPNPGQPKN